jgi:hypothetical protein
VAHWHNQAEQREPGKQIDRRAKGFALLSPTVQSLARTAEAVEWDLLAFGSVRADPAALTALRRKPGPGVGEQLSANFLKHADEQTVAAMAAACRAIHDYQLDATTFTDWGVLGAPRHLGRNVMAVALKKFFADGAWNVSPHLIPNQTLHSVAGTLSMALKIHGPNFGVGGGLNSESEGIRAAAALSADRHLPGLWLVLSAWEPEPIPDADGRNTIQSTCHAVALALVPSAAESRGPWLRLLMSEPATDCAAPTPLSVTGLADALSTQQRAHRVWTLSPVGWLEYQPGPEPE